MKTLLALAFLLTVPFCTFGQRDFNIDGTTYHLQTEVEGPISLHWNSIDGQYRFFAEKNGAFVELVNRRVDGTYQNDYRTALRELTADQNMDASRVNLTVGSLRDFLETYNKRVDSSYTVTRAPVALDLRIGAFAGATNSVFTENPENTTQPVAGVEIELLDEVKLRRHALVFRFTQTFQNDAYAYAASQFSLSYRFKFIKSQAVDVFANAKFVAYTYASRDDIESIDPVSGNSTLVSTSGGDFNAPATFGLGADIALGPGHLFLTYNDIVGLGVEDNGEFPVDFTLGYKIGL
jgi:hypothetical protein